MSVTSSSEKFPPQLEAKLLAAAARILRNDFPNAERTGCPVREALRSVACKSAGDSESRNVVDHLTCCSPCFAEYEYLVHRAKVWKSAKLLALCATLMITVGLATWFYVFRADHQRAPQPTVVQKEPSPQQPTPNNFEMAVLDLRNRSPIRGDRQPSNSDELTSLPTRRLELSVYLPIGSEEGEYEMQILRNADPPLVTQKGTASLRDQNVVVHIRTDLTGISPGRYLLRLRRANFGWRYYPVSLTP
jgi:hypothetical protein